MYEIWSEWLCTTCNTRTMSLHGVGVCQMCEQPTMEPYKTTFEGIDRQEKILRGLYFYNWGMTKYSILKHKKLKLCINNNIKEPMDSTEEICNAQIMCAKLEKFLGYEGMYVTG